MGTFFSLLLQFLGLPCPRPARGRCCCPPGCCKCPAGECGGDDCPSAFFKRGR